MIIGVLLILGVMGYTIYRGITDRCDSRWCKNCDNDLCPYNLNFD